MTTIEKKRGDTWKFICYVADDEGVAITDFTGFEAWLTVKEQHADLDAAAIIQVTLAGGGIVVADAPTGKLMATIPGTDTDSIVPKNYIADFQVKDADDVIASASLITIKVLPDITRAT